MYYPTEVRVTPLTTIRRERLLPVPGQVLVQPGELVGPADVVARCQVPGEMQVVDVSRALRVRRERAARYMRKAVGDSVQANDLLAAPRGVLGWMRGGCRAPVDGKIVEIRNGMVLIESAGTTVELRAHIKGQVSNIMPHRGVVISASGALIQGLWGSGGEAEGVLRLLVDSPQKPIRARSIDVSCHGTLIVGGWILEEKAFEQAAEARVRGIIVGSVNADLRSSLVKMPFPVMITEGFGTLPMCQPVFSLLESHAGREAMLSADVQTRWGARRPEVVIPLRAEQDLPAEEPGPVPLRIGNSVRVLRDPYLGAIGTIADLPERPQLVESGARLPVAVVDIAGGETASIPLANLELIR